MFYGKFGNSVNMQQVVAKLNTYEFDYRCKNVEPWLMEVLMTNAVFKLNNDNNENEVTMVLQKFVVEI